MIRFAYLLVAVCFVSAPGFANSNRTKIRTWAKKEQTPAEVKSPEVKPQPEPVMAGGLIPIPAMTRESQPPRKEEEKGGHPTPNK